MTPPLLSLFFIVDEKERDERKQADDRANLEDDRSGDEASLTVEDGRCAEVLNQR